VRSLATLGRRELEAVFLSPASYVILGLFLFVFAYFFRLSIHAMQGDISQSYRFFSGVVYFQILLCVVPPLLTMRSLSVERQSGTLEMLLTAPVTDRDVVLSKFLGAFAFYATLWLPTLAIPVALFRFGASPDFGQVTAFLVGLLGIGSLFVSVGIFTSSVTSNLLAAFFGALVLDVFLFFGIPGLSWISESEAVRDALAFFSIPAQLDEFARGILDVRYLVFYATGTVFFLFLAVKSLESRRWR